MVESGELIISSAMFAPQQRWYITLLVAALLVVEGRKLICPHVFQQLIPQIL